MIDENITPADLSRAGTWRVLEAELRRFVGRRVADGDVDDVVQEVFLRIQRSLGQLRDDQRFGPWVYRVARNTIIDHARSAARHPRVADVPPEAADEPPDEAEDVQREVAMYAALFVSMLQSPYREALTLTELEGLTHKEAARMLGISLPALKSRVFRGRQKLRAALEDCCHITLDVRRRVIACEPRPEGTPPDGCGCRGADLAVES
ncbi:MAG: sigma-70 family RNA polymerase sigma factor [Gammaproteobacteria bacterium]